MPNDQYPMTDAQCPMPDGASSKRTYDLKERTALFGEAIIRLASKIPVTPVTSPLITQLVEAGTSVGANYCEADEGVSRRDFRYRIGICKKESSESKFWFRMIATATPNLKSEARGLWKEAKELHLIFATIFRRNDPKSR